MIELLAVIVILAIIALIATPLILNIIEKARKNAFLDSAYGILDSARLYYTESLLDGTSGTAKVFSFDEGNSELTFGGSKPKGGMVAINKEGKISIVIYDNNWCAQKNEDASTFVLSKYEPDKCTLDHIPDVTPDDSVTPDKGQNIETVMTDEKAGANGSIRIDDNGNKRYARSEPNNYICFGMSGNTCDENHLYRIIGVFGEQMKIIKNSFYSTRIAWDTGHANDWNRPASLNTELNGNNFYGNTDYIDERSREYIANAIWYITQSPNVTFSTAKISEARGYVGLMNVSDYGYASDNEGCQNNVSLGASGNACISNNWLFDSSASQWTMSNNTNRNVWAVSYQGIVAATGPNSNIGARPSMYLKPEVKIISGEGTSTNPYILGM